MEGHLGGQDVLGLEGKVGGAGVEFGFCPRPSAFSSRGHTFSTEEREARTRVGGTEGDVEGITRGKAQRDGVLASRAAEGAEW